MVEVMLEEGFMKADKNKDGKISKAESENSLQVDQPALLFWITLQYQIIVTIAIKIIHKLGLKLLDVAFCISDKIFP